MDKIENLIIGAGISGLMMGYRLRDDYLIVERSESISTVAGGPFYLHNPIRWLPTRWKEVDVHHNCWDGVNWHRIPDLRMMNDYSKKITGKIIDTSLKFMDGKPKRGYLPASGQAGAVLQDLLDEVGPKIRCGTEVVGLDTDNKIAHLAFVDGGEDFVEYERIISTLPLPVLLKVLLKQDLTHKFQADPIHAWYYSVDPNAVVDAYQIVNITTPTYEVYRAALMHNSLFIESMEEMNEGDNSRLIERLWNLDGAFKLEEKVVIRPGKFHPIEKTARRMMLAKITQDYEIYCLGRFAVWDYKRIDHIAEDVESILEIIAGRN